jgi:hypothetical protein
VKEARDQNAYAHGHPHISGYVKATNLDTSAAVKLVYTERLTSMLTFAHVLLSALSQVKSRMGFISSVLK